MTVCFLGLGALGLPMAENLLRAGLPLRVHNRHRDRELPLAAEGAERGNSPAEAVMGAELICLCLSDGSAVRQVLLGQDTPDDGPPGLADGPADTSGAAIHGLSPGALVIDFSTIAPSGSEAIAAHLAGRRVGYIDAPVTGGTEGAKAGTLSVLVGGKAEDLERARPLLEVVGSRVTHFGPVGAGQRAKAVNQVLVAGNFIAVAEAMALGRRLGLPMDVVVEALKSGAAGSWTLAHRARNMLMGEFPLGFKLELHHKDLGIALAAAEDVGLDLPMCKQVAAMEASLIAEGYGSEDVSALARLYEVAGYGDSGSTRSQKL
jgi:3-hydroxyisobutyrate dehydrogenase-like beta-hydroxyacid dehydrogenase